MGLSKYAEDNYEILCERLTMKGDDQKYLWYITAAAQTVTVNQKEEDSFAEMFKAESCFSF